MFFVEIDLWQRSCSCLSPILLNRMPAARGSDVEASLMLAYASDTNQHSGREREKHRHRLSALKAAKSPS